MNLGDTGDDVKAFQESVGLTADGDCGHDTWLRWRAGNDATLHWILCNFARLIGVIDTYSEAHVGPAANDCSGSLCIALRISKGHHQPGNPTPLDFGTGGILADALGDQLVFAATGGPDEFGDLVPGDLLVYGPHNGMAGHVCAWAGDGVIIDCSASHNGVHCHVDDLAHFLVPHPGRPVYVVRFLGPERA